MIVNCEKCGSPFEGQEPGEFCPECYRIVFPLSDKLPTLSTRLIGFVVTQECYQKEAGSAQPGRALFLPYIVALERLSPLARRVAEGITSTNAQDQLSEVLIRTHRTREELIRALWEDGAEVSVDAYIAVMEKVHGQNHLQQRAVFPWPWEPLPVGEQPEEYLNRQAVAMAAQGNIEHVALEPYPMLASKEVASRLGVTPRQVGNLCVSGVFPSAQKIGGVWLIPASDLYRPEVINRPIKPGPRPTRKYLALTEDQGIIIVEAANEGAALQQVEQSLSLASRQDAFQQWVESGRQLGEVVGLIQSGETQWTIVRPYRPFTQWLGQGIMAHLRDLLTCKLIPLSRILHDS